MSNEKHKWVIKEDGTKICSKCQSRIQNKKGFSRYFEVDTWGIGETVNWYPRCNPPKNDNKTTK